MSTLLPCRVLSNLCYISSGQFVLATPPAIDGEGDGLKMIGVNTARVEAKMVDLESSRDWPLGFDVGSVVDWDISPFQMHAAILPTLAMLNAVARWRRGLPSTPSGYVCRVLG